MKAFCPLKLQGAFNATFTGQMKLTVMSVYTKQTSLIDDFIYFGWILQKIIASYLLGKFFSFFFVVQF